MMPWKYGGSKAQVSREVGKEAEDFRKVAAIELPISRKLCFRCLKGTKIPTRPICNAIDLAVPREPAQTIMGYLKRIYRFYGKKRR